MRSILALILILLTTMRFVGSMQIISVPFALRLRSIPGSAHCDEMVKFAMTMTFLPKALHFLGGCLEPQAPQAPPQLVECDSFLLPDLLLGFLTESICLLLSKFDYFLTVAKVTLLGYTL